MPAEGSSSFILLWQSADEVADRAQRLPSPLPAGAAFNWDRALEISNNPTSVVMEIF